MGVSDMISGKKQRSRGRPRNECKELLPLSAQTGPGFVFLSEKRVIIRAPPKTRQRAAALRDWPSFVG